MKIRYYLVILLSCALSFSKSNNAILQGDLRIPSIILILILILQKSVFVSLTASVISYLSSLIQLRLLPLRIQVLRPSRITKGNLSQNEVPEGSASHSGSWVEKRITQADFTIQMIHFAYHQSFNKFPSRCCKFERSFEILSILLNSHSVSIVIVNS